MKTFICQWLTRITPFFMLGLFHSGSLTAAEPMPPPFLTNFWRAEWPPLQPNGMPPLRIRSVENVKAGKGTLDFTVKFYAPGTLGGASIIVPSESVASLPTNWLRGAPASLLTVNVASALTNRVGDIVVVRAEPPVIELTRTEYRLSANFRVFGPEKESEQLRLQVGTIYEDALVKCAQANQIWCEEKLELLKKTFTSTDTNQTIAYFAERAAVDSGFNIDGNQAAITATLKGRVETAGKRPNGVLNALAPSYGNDVKRAILALQTSHFDDQILGFLVSQLSGTSFTDLTNKLQTATGDEKIRASDKRDDLFWVLLMRHLGASIRSAQSLRRVEGLTTVASTASSEVKEVEFTSFKGRIIGFTNFVESIEQLTTKDAAHDLGRGIADNFIAVWVKFNNQSTNDLLLYGDRVEFGCTTEVVTPVDSSGYRLLIGKTPDTVFDRVGTATNKLATRWTGKIVGVAEPVSQPMKFTPIPLSYLIAGFDKRVFDTTKARVFRGLDTAASIATGVIPFVGTKTYADYTGIFTGIGLPSAKKLIGDMTDIQRNTFLQHSLPQYMELKRGQTVAKLVYLPRFGADKIQTGKVVFIRNLGDKQSFKIHAAMIRSIDEEEPAQ